MGRRPNSLVGEFFERGQKLHDSSNRYQHTCKKCGQLFPKGRVDNLMSHLLRRCPNVTQDDRQWILHQMQQNADNERSNKKTEQSSKGLPLKASQEELQSDIHVPYVQQQQQPQSALETLAEVSRRHLDYSSPLISIREEHGYEQNNVGEQDAVEQALVNQLQERPVTFDKPTTNADSAGLYVYPTDTPQQTQQIPDAAIMATAALAASPLVHAASAANRQLEQTQGQSVKLNDASVDPQLHEVAAQVRARIEESNAASRRINEADAMVWSQTTPSRAEQALGSLSFTSNEPNPSFGVLQRPSKNKVRGRFNDARRKEVQEIRKRGACIRCRMLKKPCSGETPCKTCRNVASARLWKGTCLRTRVADEFTLWSQSLFRSKLKMQVSAAVQGLAQITLPGRIEARFTSQSDLCLKFSVKRHTNSPTVYLDLQPKEDGETLKSTDIWLLDEGEELVDKLEGYISKIADSYIENESSHFMRATLEKATIIVRADEQTCAAKTAEAQHLPRSCYSLHTLLLKDVVELWVETRLLTSPNEHVLELRYNSRKIPHRKPNDVLPTTNKEIETSSIPPLSESYKLIQSQLFAAIESRCSQLSRTIMNELERRLLQRQQVSSFATFLSSVILLNCVERMTGFYYRSDTGNIPHQTQGEPRIDVDGAKSIETATAYSGAEGTSDNPSSRTLSVPEWWPLESPPSVFWPQGGHFADLLIMLLHMRALPPKTTQTQGGTLMAIQERALPVYADGCLVEEEIDEQTRAAAEWLDPLMLKVSDLINKRYEQLPEKEEGLEVWDLKFISRVLLPESFRLDEANQR